MLGGTNASLEALGAQAAILGASLVQLVVGCAVLVGSVYTLTRVVESGDETPDDTDAREGDIDLEALDPSAL
ncbi:hypothetical protein [Haloterrigena alkaliphila]|uniref:Uncharacterized protein n=1 Tax=Haloterrigena alkaliphila TaxID=2816475 RepID=A0A8A2VB03_9EURY|nr:hypothetical protein [Haloterrigena alkaliphila]QSW98661.1 hypothetical protein J0X25_14875 [Haloterrigena alkaliphila]